MKIICPNCRKEIDLRDYPIQNISMCPFCGNPFVFDGISVAWA